MIAAKGLNQNCMLPLTDRITESLNGLPLNIQTVGRQMSAFLFLSLTQI